MDFLNRFNQRGFFCWWAQLWLQGIFCAWAVTGLLGFFLHNRGSSELSNMLSDIFIHVVILTAIVQGTLWLCRKVTNSGDLTVRLTASTDPDVLPRR